VGQVSAVEPADESGRGLGSVAGAQPVRTNTVPAHESNSLCFEDKNTILQEMAIRRTDVKIRAFVRDEFRP